MNRELFWLLMTKIGLAIAMVAPLLIGMPLDFIGVMVFFIGASIWSFSYGRLFEMERQS